VIALKHFFLDKNELGMWELRNDAVFDRIPQDRYIELIDFAWNIGREAAEECRDRYQTNIPAELAKKLGLSLLELQSGSSFSEYRVFSEYYSNLKRIVIYNKTIMEEYNKLVSDGFTELKDFIAMRELFITHEIFHHLECHVIGLTSRKKKITTFQIGPFKISSGVRAMCEIGAHSFTKTLLGI